MSLIVFVTFFLYCQIDEPDILLILLVLQILKIKDMSLSVPLNLLSITLNSQNTLCLVAEQVNMTAQVCTVLAIALTSNPPAIRASLLHPCRSFHSVENQCPFRNYLPIDKAFRSAESHSIYSKE